MIGPPKIDPSHLIRELRDGDLESREERSGFYTPYAFEKFVRLNWRFGDRLFLWSDMRAMCGCSGVAIVRSGKIVAFHREYLA